MSTKQYQTNVEQMRLTAAFHMKYGLYRDPAFRFFQSMGMFNFFQRFKSDDLDLGVFHFYWDKNAENTIEHHDPKTGERTNNIKGDWRERWYNPGEELEPVETANPYRPDPQKMGKWWMETHASIQAKIILKQRVEQSEQNQDDEPWKYLPKPYWEEIN